MSTDPLQPPIIVIDESECPELYPTIEAAMADMEGVDVADGIYRVFDAAGRRITLRAAGVRRGRWSVDIGTVHFDHAEDVPTGTSDLQKLLSAYLNRHEPICGSDESLSNLLRLVQECHRR